MRAASQEAVAAHQGHGKREQGEVFWVQLTEAYMPVQFVLQAFEQESNTPKRCLGPGLVGKGRQ